VDQPIIEIIQEPEDPVLSPEEARILRAAELRDELIRLEKKKARLRISRILGSAFMALATSASSEQLGPGE
jgi:hypothetical protein